ncbi:Hypothetical_protein [Hexamita inflata]|uniref:Hypothetical_protein n=1 Tax=Hexamita inflata TaxID=28002 RepID=A0AA86TYJ8_9EUKA|nr:Hypothetical protein HINF_LOCUS21149 [Hexamita inflata]
MCWSTKASFTFAGLFFLGCLYLLYRNDPRDKLRVVFFAPILIQEFLQGAIWLFMTPDDTPWTCSDMNKRFSTGLLVVQVIPILKVVKDSIIYKSSNSLDAILYKIQCNQLYNQLKKQTSKMINLNLISNVCSKCVTCIILDVINSYHY